MDSVRARPPDSLERLSYVIASRQREKVLAAVIPGPKTPGQLAKNTGLRLPHVSRTLGELVRAGLVRSVGAERRGKLYAPTNLGVAVFSEVADARGDRLVAPMVRGSQFRNYHHWVSVRRGRTAADSLLLEAGIDPARLDVDRWYPLRSVLEVLDLVESRFGDGTYEATRTMLREEAGNFASLRRLLTRALPLPLLLELSPNAYNRDYNHGRLEVDVQDRRALMKHYDWMSSPARCAAWLGTYEGFLALIGIQGTVTKVACMLKDDPYCGYLISW